MASSSSSSESDQSDPNPNPHPLIKTLTFQKRSEPEDSSEEGEDEKQEQEQVEKSPKSPPEKHKKKQKLSTPGQPSTKKSSAIQRIWTPEDEMTLLRASSDQAPKMETTEENASSVCVVCREPEAPWSCQRKGCNRRFHSHCAKVHRPGGFITVGGWHCVDCIKDKLQFGAAFACDEVESILDVRHGKSEAIYWVKHKNLAHIYNCWKPESVIRQEAPELLARFIQEYKQVKGTTWKKEWTMPERLLLQRNLMHVDMAQTFFQGQGSQLQFCNTEWLVKWMGLGYEHATWELKSLQLLDKKLVQEHNHRQSEAARRAKLASEHNKIKNPFVRLEAFPNGFPHDLDDGYLDSLNRLRQFWHKSQNAVLIDQEEKVRIIVLFIKSIVDGGTAQPFLILSTMKSLSLWEHEIRQLMPSVHTVVHTNKFSSFLVEVTEFWGQDGHLLFQVLLSQPDAIQGFQAIEQISWEGVIVDQCDNVNMSTHLEQMKTLSADFKMLILNTHLKDDPSQYVKLLSVLEPGDTYSVSDISILKERFSRYIVYQTDTAASNCQEAPSAEREFDCQGKAHESVAKNKHAIKTSNAVCIKEMSDLDSDVNDGHTRSRSRPIKDIYINLKFEPI